MQIQSQAPQQVQNQDLLEVKDDHLETLSSSAVHNFDIESVIENTEDVQVPQDRIIHLGINESLVGYKRKICNQINLYPNFEVHVHNFSEKTFSFLYEMKTKFDHKFGRTVCFNLGEYFSKGHIEVLHSIIRDKELFLFKDRQIKVVVSQPNFLFCSFIKSFPQIDSLFCHEECLLDTRHENIPTTITDFHITLNPQSVPPKPLKFPYNLRNMNNIKHMVIGQTGYRWDQIDGRYYPNLLTLTYTQNDSAAQMRRVQVPQYNLLINPPRSFVLLTINFGERNTVLSDWQLFQSVQIQIVSKVKMVFDVLEMTQSAQQYGSSKSFEFEFLIQFPNGKKLFTRKIHINCNKIVGNVYDEFNDLHFNYI